MVGFFGDVGGEQDGHVEARAGAVEGFPEDSSCVDVEPGGWFVEEQDGGVGDECSCEIGSAGESAGEVADLVVEAVGEPEFGSDGFDAGLDLGFGEIVQRAGDHEVFGDGEELVEGGGLEDDGEGFAGGGGDDFARAWGDGLGDDVEEG